MESNNDNETCTFSDGHGSYDMSNMKDQQIDVHSKLQEVINDFKSMFEHNTVEQQLRTERKMSLRI